MQDAVRGARRAATFAGVTKLAGSLWIHLFDTALGVAGLSWTERGVFSVELPGADRAETRARLVERVRALGATVDVTEVEAARALPSFVRDAAKQIFAHLAGAPRELARIPLDLGAVSAFEEKIYRALQDVPSGQTTTYGALARAVGSPGASRAVGRAMAKNPVPLLVPCHRVLAAGGNPGGFSAYGGLVTKERLLAVEGATTQMSLFAKATKASPLPFDADVAMAELRAADPLLGRLFDRVGPFTLRLEDTADTFAALAESIVYQQLHGKAAATIFGRLRGLFPAGELHPTHILTASDAALRGAGLSANKLASLRDLAARTDRGEIPKLAELRAMDDERIIEQLTAVRGIGRWTVEMLLIFRLGRPDVLPLADFGVRKGFERAFKRASKEGPSALARRGQRWVPYRTVASWYLWRAAELP